MTRPVPQPCTCTSIRRVARSLARAYDNALAPAGLNATQLAVMRGVDRHAGEPMVRVAEDLNLDRTSLYRALTPLRRKGWIEVRDGSGGRARTAAVTPGGLSVLDEASPLWDAMQIAVIERFGRRAWRDLVADLQRLHACIPDPGTEDRR